MRSEVIIDPRLSSWLDRVSEFFDAMFRDKLQIFHYSAVSRGANAEQSPISSRRCSLDARSIDYRDVLSLVRADSKSRFDDRITIIRIG